MEHAHTAVALPANDRILAALLDQGSLPEVAQRLNMSLAALATWTRENARLLADLKRLLKERCKLLTLQHASAAVTALAGVSRSATTTDDAKLRERALERQRKAATTILRHRTTLERTRRVKGASGVSHAPPHSHKAASTNADRISTSAPPSTIAEWQMANAASSQPKPTLAERFAQRRLAMMAST